MALALIVGVGGWRWRWQMALSRLAFGVRQRKDVIDTDDNQGKALAKVPVRGIDITVIRSKRI